MKPKDLFQNVGAEQEVFNQGQAFNLIQKTEFTDNGVLTYFIGGHFPQKGFSPASAIVAIGLAKKVFIQGFMFFKKIYFLPSLILFPFLSKRKLIEFFVTRYNEIAHKTMRPFILNEKYMMPFSKELLIVLNNFLRKLGVDDFQAERFSYIISHIFEFDNSYRYRAEDLFTAVSKEDFIKKPVRTFYKIAKLALIRSGDDFRVAKNKRNVLMFASLVMLFPSIRKAWRFAISGCEYKNLCLDEIDEYWVSMRNDYDYYGEDVATRSLRNKDRPIPQMFTKEQLDELNKRIAEKAEEIKANHRKNKKK